MELRYFYTMEYLPTRYEASQSEWNNRRAVWNFKDGNCSSVIIDFSDCRTSRYPSVIITTSRKEIINIRYFGACFDLILSFISNPRSAIRYSAAAE